MTLADGSSLHSKIRVFVLVAALTLSLLAQGCAIRWAGRKVPKEKAGDFVVAETTIDEVKAVLGEPEDVFTKPNQGITVYIYRKIVHVFVGLGIPGLLSVGRTSQDGFELKVIFKDGLYVNYELLERGR